MQEKAIILYCICDRVVTICNIIDDQQMRMSSAEIMTFSILSASYFGGNYKQTRLISKHYRFFSYTLSHSRIVRRIHQIPEMAWHMAFLVFQLFLRDFSQRLFIVDSFPVKAYENHKSFRARIFREKKYHGYAASRKHFFFGIKVHMVVDGNGIPIEFTLTPGSKSDLQGLNDLSLELPENSILLGDRAYTSYRLEDYLSEFEGIKLLPKRKHNARRQHSREDSILLAKKRNRIETVFSSIVSRMPRSIKARTEKGFCLKVVFFIFAYMLHLFQIR